jgi:hypothetical protein
MSWRAILPSIVALLLIGTVVPYRNDLGWVDPVTGSVRFQRRWFLIPTSTVVHTTVIEEWIVRHEGRYKPSWQFIFDTSSTWLGRGHACDTAPESYSVHLVDRDFVRISTDAEIDEFVRVMRKGTKDDRKKVVEALCDKVLQASQPIERTSLKR